MAILILVMFDINQEKDIPLEFLILLEFMDHPVQAKNRTIKGSLSALSLL
jgi:hypothetical protein